jgi:hypothetical protein
MASSVSSERAFSSAGITISKRRNRLKADIIEALQCLKVMIWKDLMVRELPSSATEDLEDNEDSTEGGVGEAETPWDLRILLDDNGEDM